MATLFINLGKVVSRARTITRVDVEALGSRSIDIRQARARSGIYYTREPVSFCRANDDVHRRPSARCAHTRLLLVLVRPIELLLFLSFIHPPLAPARWERRKRESPCRWLVRLFAVNRAEAFY